MIFFIAPLCSTLSSIRSPAPANRIFRYSKATSFFLVYTRQARKDAKKLKGTPLAKKAKELLAIIQEDPFAEPPPFEALAGDLKGACSRRINIQHRLVYEVLGDKGIVKVFRLRTHYE